MRGAYCIAAKGDPNDGGGWSNQQLRKDCGLVPWLLAKNHGWRGVMVGMKCSDAYPNLVDMPELELEFLSEDTSEARLKYVEENAAGMDLLILYGAYPHYIPLVRRYKQVRPDGLIYLASDMNLGWAKRIPHAHPLYQEFLSKCDIIGASNTTVQAYMARQWRFPVKLIRNGYYDAIPALPKENIILTVGRIGAMAKQTHVLLEAFAAVAEKLPTWELRLVGAVEAKFKRFIEGYFLSHPQLRGRVTFTGLIEDRAALMAEYARAKVFCLPSSFEGTPNAAADALHAGCYMITSSVEAANDITDKGRCGRVFPIGDTARLAKLLKEICRNEKLLLKGGAHAAAYAHAYFDMIKIVARLNGMLDGGSHNGKD